MADRTRTKERSTRARSETRTVRENSGWESFLVFYAKGPFLGLESKSRHLFDSDAVATQLHIETEFLAKRRQWECKCSRWGMYWVNNRLWSWGCNRDISTSDSSPSCSTSEQPVCKSWWSAEGTFWMKWLAKIPYGYISLLQIHSTWALPDRAGHHSPEPQLVFNKILHLQLLLPQLDSAPYPSTRRYISSFRCCKSWWSSTSRWTRCW